MRKKLRLSAALLALNLALIWGNSLLPGSDSGAMSGGITELLMSLPVLRTLDAELVHTLIRKLAHFTEFACLGALLTWRCRMTGKYREYPLLLSMAAALLDETIQMFTPDRGPGLTDVWIDVSGAAAGMLLVGCGYHVLKRINQNKR